MDRACHVGILFADISGSMKLYEAFGNHGALAAIETCCNLICGIVDRNGGKVVKTIGDEVMGAFPDPASAWRAAVQMQTEIEGLEPLQSATGPIKLGLRVGFNFGQAIASGDDFFGEAVNVAARMVQLAKRGHIITTADSAALLAAERVASRDLDWLAVKGKPDGVQVVEIIWKDDKAGHMTIIDLASFTGGKPAGSELRLSLGGRSWVCDSTCVSVSIGREAINTVVLASTVASRNHATIERRRDRWVLIDHSSNGTFVTSAGRDMHLRHEETILAESGSIGFGMPVLTSQPETCLDFVIEQR